MARVSAGLNVVSERKIAPEAKYTLVIKKPVDFKALSDKSDLGDTAYEFIFWPAIEGAGELDGHEIRHRATTSTKGSRWFLKTFLTGIGVSVAEDGSFDTDDVPGKRFSTIVKQRTYKDKNDRDAVANELDPQGCIRA